MLNLKGWTADRIRDRAAVLRAEAATFEAQGCHHLARLKLRDASFYDRQLRPAVA